MFGTTLAIALTATAMLLVMLAVIQRRDYVHDCEVDGWIAKRDILNDEVYNLKDELAKVRHEHEELIVVFKARNEARASEIQNLHSVYQRKLDDADEQLKIESRSLASELEEVQEQCDVARAELEQARLANYEKAKELAKLQDDVALLSRRLQDYDERIRASESARLVAESQLSSIREVCCGR